MSLVTSTIRGPFQVLALDLTGNRDGWEHPCSQGIVAKLIADGVPVVSSAVQHATDLRALGAVFEAIQDEYSVLLLFGHGAAGVGGAAGGVDVGELEASWQLLEQVEMHLENALVLLCVCEGICTDSIGTVVRGDHLALTMIGPEGSLSPKEADAFFPEFLKALHEQRPGGGIEVDVVEWALSEHNQLAGDKMVLV